MKNTTDGKTRSISQQVLIDLIKSRIIELNELLSITTKADQKNIIKARISESLEWLMTLGETVGVAK